MEQFRLTKADQHQHVEEVHGARDDNRKFDLDDKKMDEILSTCVSPPAKILVYLSATSLTAGEIAERFDMAKPSISKHLSILENAGLISREKNAQFVHYNLAQENLVNTLNGFVQDIRPVSRPIKKESRRMAAAEPDVDEPVAET